MESRKHIVLSVSSRRMSTGRWRFLKLSIMKWQVEILSQTVAEELDSLPADMRAKFDHIVQLIEEFGPHHVREPYVKPIQDKLWEMRMKGRDGIARAIYVTETYRRVVILHVFRKKTRRTPKAAIRTALSRMEELKS